MYSVVIVLAVEDNLVGFVELFAVYIIRRDYGPQCFWISLEFE